MKKACILDYGSGNVKSVFNLLSYLRYEVVISNNPEDIKSSTHIILPGVGAFGKAMEKITKSIPLDIVEDHVISRSKPFLGICVGMQVMFEEGMEHGVFKGLGWLPGSVDRLDVNKLPLPHIGWNNIEIKRNDILFHELDEINDFYFVHSYKTNTDEEYVLGETLYGKNFCSVVKKNNLVGVQFHPEKSQKAGLKLIQNFMEYYEEK